MLGDAMLVEIAAGLTGARRGASWLPASAVTTSACCSTALPRRWTSKPACNRTAASSNGRCSPATAPAGSALRRRERRRRALSARCDGLCRLTRRRDSAVDVAKDRQRGSLAFYNQASEASSPAPADDAPRARERDRQRPARTALLATFELAGAPWRASRDSCAGNIRSSAPSARTSSSRWQSTTR